MERIEIGIESAMDKDTVSVMDVPQVFEGKNMPQEISVSQVSIALKRVVEGEFAFVRVRGEISGFKRATSGHLYMDLKDENAVIHCVCWKGVAAKVKIVPADGMDVVVVGKITTYVARSKYQLIVTTIEIAGQGAFFALLQDRKERLTKEGVFDRDKKKPLPKYPKTIGVITSETGAVVKDILSRVQERFIEWVYIYPCTVQGQNAVAQIVGAIDFFNRQKNSQKSPLHVPDVIIVARGGGSIEDLWTFNEEDVVRAIAQSKIPIISAIGHETDTTLVDYAADFRSPTPTAAAEKVAPTFRELYTLLQTQNVRRYTAFSKIITENTLRLDTFCRALPNMGDIVHMKIQRIDDMVERLKNLPHNMLAKYDNKLLRCCTLPNMTVVVERKQQTADHMAERLRNLRLHMFSPYDTALLRCCEKLMKPNVHMQERFMRLKNATDALMAYKKRYIQSWTTELKNLTLLLESYSFKKTLDRGFAVVRDMTGTVIKEAKSAQQAKDITITFSKDTISAKVK